ncbi:MAG: HAMP domain-containing protein [Deltaproteobacteria bacterium]|nr:HAMP domain-containing protein [Deltaproteobacteria bacterium]
MRFRNLSIKRKLLIIMMGISTVALTAACTAFVFVEIQSFKETMVRDLSTLAEVIGHNSSASLVFSDGLDAEETLKSLEAKPTVTAAWLFRADNRLLADYHRDGAAGTSPPLPPEKDNHRFTAERLIIHRLIALNDQKVGAIILMSDMKGMQLILRRSLMTIVGVLLASFLLTYLLSSRLRTVISNPITELAGVAKKVSREKDYAARVVKHEEDEIGSLFDAFNDMLEEIHKRDTELVGAKQKAEASAKEAGDLLATMEQVNLELEREVRERKQIEAELMHHRAQLEHLVERRTAQLTEANLHLKQEIEEKRRVEKDIRRALDEKVVLLGEIHHRVKNNLQIIASLLEMSRRRARTPEAAEQLGEAHAKIFTMALIHSQLYRNDRFDEVNMERHARDLFTHLANLYCDGKEVDVRIRMSNLRLPVTQAIPCALILNELISNAFKYAFAGGDDGTLSISMTQDKHGVVCLEVQDDGPGLPEDIDVYNASSLGLKLVRNLVVHQLKGSMRINGRPGTQIQITFPVSREDNTDA